LDSGVVLDAARGLAPEATLHGFRSSFRSWCGDHGVPREVAEQCLAHKFGSQVEQAYNRTAMLERRRPVMQDRADFIDGRQAAKVTRLRGKGDDPHRHHRGRLRSYRRDAAAGHRRL
jgi:hypothetical protein